MFVLNKSYHERNCTLPEDLIIEISLWLPVKSLLQFRSVCKQWHAIIKSPSFVRRQLYHERNCTRFIVYLHAIGLRNERYGEYYAFAYIQDETLERHEEPDHLKLPGLIKALCGSCNGIFCVVNTAHRLAMWNPATRRMRPLPYPPQELRNIDEIGLGIDPLSNELKIVLIIGAGHLSQNLIPCYAVYSSRNDSWKYYEDKVLLETYACVSETQCGTTFLNGFYYWKKSKINKNIGHSIISSVLAFDMHNEVFQEIEMPEIVRSRAHGELGLYNDSLVLFSYDKNVNDKQIDMWVMKEKGCWTKLLTCVLPFEFEFPLGFWKNKQLFESAGTYHIPKLMVYDLDSHTTRNIRLEQREVAHTTRSLQCYYKESLVSIVENGILDYDIQSEVIRKYLVRKWPCDPINRLVY